MKDSKLGTNFIVEDEVKADIIDIFNTKPRRASQIVKSKYHDAYTYISNEYSGKTFSEKVFRFINVDYNYMCPVCNESENKFMDFKRGFSEFCSRRCTANSKEVKLRKEHTNLKKYGKAHYSQTDEYATQYKNTCMERYGVDNPSKSDEVKDAKKLSRMTSFFGNLDNRIPEKIKPLFDVDKYDGVRGSRKYEWECRECNTVFSDHIDCGTDPACPTCNPEAHFSHISIGEKEMVTFIKGIYDGEIIENDRQLLKPKEVDIYLPEKKLAIEFNGVYWHSGDKVASDYHFNKQNDLRENGIMLLTIFDIEWKSKRNIIENIIKSKLGITNRIYARKCTIRTLDTNTARNFLDSNHLNGYAGSSIKVGLYHDEILVAVIGISKARFEMDKNTYEITRFASLLNHTIVGGFSKLLKYCIREYKIGTLLSYADARIGNGNVYEACGFERISHTKPGYWYRVGDQLVHRLNYSKKKLVEMGYDSNKTGKMIADEIGLIRVYDCGNIKFKLNIGEKNE